MIGNPGITKASSFAVENADIYTIAGGIATIQQVFAIIAAESSTSDDLDTITLGSNFAGIGTYRPTITIQADTGDTITVRHNTGNIFLYGAANVTLTGNQVLILFYNGSKWMDSAKAGGGGTVTSVGLSTDASYLTVGSSPVVGAGTITLNKTAALTANRFVATPNGAPGAADLRAIVAADLPTIPISGGGTGQTAQTAAFNALSPLTTAGDIITRDGTNNIRLAMGTALQEIRVNAGATALEYFTSSAGSVPLFYRAGLGIVARTVALLEVGVGEMTVESTIVSKTTTTLLNMATAGDWIGGSSLESASEYVEIYADAAGNIKLYDKMPNYPRANTASRVANMRVNQAGWNGTAASGLNATSIVYDGDTGEGSVTAGMLLGIYSDSTFEKGLGRCSAAASSDNNASFALITAISTGGAGGTLTVAAGHNIAINDDDYLIVIEYGALEYINVSATWWRLIGRMFNNSGSDLDTNRVTKRAFYTLDEGADLTTSSTSFVAVSALLSLPILVGVGDIRGDFFAAVANGAAVVYMDMSLDSIAPANDGATITGGASVVWTNTFYREFGVLPGTHTLEVRWKVSSGTATMYAGAGTAAFDLHPQLTVIEVPTQ